MEIWYLFSFCCQCSSHYAVVGRNRCTRCDLHTTSAFQCSCLELIKESVSFNFRILFLHSSLNFLRFMETESSLPFS
jgi:predicted amidophosphoribosyltransferase